jgi:hypothetical protein
MAVTSPADVSIDDADERVALSVSALYELTNPDPTVRDWLEFVVGEVARTHSPGDRVELPTGDSSLRLILVVPDPHGGQPLSLAHAAELHPQS